MEREEALRAVLAGGAGLAAAIVGLAAPVVLLAIAVSNLGFGFGGSTRASGAQVFVMVLLPLFPVLGGALPARVLCRSWRKAGLFSAAAHVVAVLVFFGGLAAGGRNFSPATYFAVSAAAVLVAASLTVFLCLIYSGGGLIAFGIATAVLFGVVLVPGTESAVPLLAGLASWPVLSAVAAPGLPRSPSEA